MAEKKRNNKIFYVTSSTAKTLANYLMHKGLDSNSIEALLECSIDDLNDVEHRIPMNQYHKLWALALTYTKEPALALTLGSKPFQDEMGLVGHIFFNNDTLDSALKQYERYYALVHEGMHIEVKTDAKFAYINYICDTEEAYSQTDMEYTLAISIYRATLHIRDGIEIEHIYFQHSPPTYKSNYTEVFPCPVKFNHTHCSIVFKKQYLNFKLPKRSSYLHQLLTHHIEAIFKKLRPEETLTDKVVNLVEKKLAKDNIDATHIADKLCMSRHTLYRKLKQEGLSFHDLVDQVRKDKAFYYLNQNKRSLSEIAFLLGFSELSAFSRAFKRWTGISPAKHIKQNVKS
jgi:AraC-like DNA-binding protein